MAESSPSLVQQLRLLLASPSYLACLAVNQLGSAVFYYSLATAPLSLVSPVVNTAKVGWSRGVVVLGRDWECAGGGDPGDGAAAGRAPPYCPPTGRAAAASGRLSSPGSQHCYR